MTENNAEFKFDMSTQIEKARREAERTLETTIVSSARSIAQDLMASGKYHGKEGLGHEIIRKKIEELILSDAFSIKIDQIVEEVTNEETMRAVRSLINSKARKVLFSATYPVK